MRLLLVEDYVPLADELLVILNNQGYVVDWLVDGRDAAIQGNCEPYDLVILDLGLPGTPGLEILQAWRKANCTFPVLILSARSSWAERIIGLKAGADDYLTKPFHPEELLLRIQSLLRRAKGVANDSTLTVHGLELNEAKQCAIKDGQEIELTAAEFRLLRYFMLHPAKILSKTQLNEHIYDGETERDSNVIEVHINHLRYKLGKNIIETKRGQGYRFNGVTA